MPVSGSGQHSRHATNAPPNNGTDEHHQMTALLGAYPGTREASGTSWQPEATPMSGLHWMAHDWSFMLHGIYVEENLCQEGCTGGLPSETEQRCNNCNDKKHYCVL
jgi:hypothetical protein